MPTIAKLPRGSSSNDDELTRLAETLEYVTTRYYDANRRSRRIGDELDHAATCYGVCRSVLADKIAGIEAVTPRWPESEGTRIARMVRKHARLAAQKLRARAPGPPGSHTGSGHTPIAWGRSGGHKGRLRALGT